MELDEYVDMIEQNVSLLFQSNPELAVEIKKYVNQLGQLLIDCVESSLQDYYESYYPKIYTRRLDIGMENWDLIHALDIVSEAEINLTTNTCDIRLYFKSPNAYGTSLFGGEDGYLPELINSGWSVGYDKWFHHIHRFGYYEGNHYIDNGIDEFNNQVNDPNVTVTLTRDSI